MQSISLPSMIPFIITTNNDVYVLLSEKNVESTIDEVQGIGHQFVCRYIIIKVY